MCRVVVACYEVNILLLSLFIRKRFSIMMASIKSDQLWSSDSSEWLSCTATCAREAAHPRPSTPESRPERPHCVPPPARHDARDAHAACCPRSTVALPSRAGGRQPLACIVGCLGVSPALHSRSGGAAVTHSCARTRKSPRLGERENESRVGMVAGSPGSRGAKK